VVLSNTLIGLFPPGTVVAESRDPGDVTELLPTEAVHLGGAVAERAQEFAAGRQCARRALAEFGIDGFALCPAPDRQPVWPRRITGSITHTDGFCAAVVALRQHIAGIGIDSECVGAVAKHLWPSIYVPAELTWLKVLPQAEQAAAAAVIFSAKEAFHKCQYPLFGERLKFHDICLRVEEWGDGVGVWSLQTTKILRVTNGAVRPIAGRYLFHEEFVSSGVALAAVPQST